MILVNLLALWLSSLLFLQSYSGTALHPFCPLLPLLLFLQLLQPLKLCQRIQDLLGDPNFEITGGFSWATNFQSLFKTMQKTMQNALLLRSREPAFASTRRNDPARDVPDLFKISTSNRSQKHSFLTREI